MVVCNYLRGYDHFNRVCEHVVGVESYYDFPSSLLVHGESLNTSTLWSVDDVVFFRRRNKQLTLLAWFCDNAYLCDVLGMLKGGGYNVKSFAFTYVDDVGLNTRSAGWEYYVDDSWSLEWLLGEISSESRRKMRRTQEKVSVLLELDWDVDEASAMQLHADWLSEAKTRHFMAVSGYSKRFIQRYYAFGDNTELFGWRDKQGQLYGMVGYEVYDGQAQVLLMKHRIDGNINGFGQYMWIYTLEHLLSVPGIDKVHCGSLTDTLKQRLRMQKVRSWKVVV